MTMFTGTAGVQTFRAISLRSGLKLYAKTGIKPNRTWSPTRMLKAAEEITGETFKRGQYGEAVKALDKWIEENGTAG